TTAPRCCAQSPAKAEAASADLLVALNWCMTRRTLHVSQLKASGGASADNHSPATPYPPIIRRLGLQSLAYALCGGCRGFARLPGLGAVRGGLPANSAAPARPPSRAGQGPSSSF